MQISARQAVRPAAPRTIEALLLAVTRHDPYTGAHSARVAQYSLALGRVLGLPLHHQHSLRHASLVHDSGKAYIPKHILRKVSHLDDNEFDLIRRHPTIGARLVARVPGGESLVRAVRHHHERWDGRGYPGGLERDEIPLEARLIFVADAFDAMTTARPYGEILTPAEAIEEIGRCAGTQFDPGAVGGLHEAHAAGLLGGHEPPIARVD